MEELLKALLAAGFPEDQALELIKRLSSTRESLASRQGPVKSKDGRTLPSDIAGGLPRELAELFREFVQDPLSGAVDRRREQFENDDSLDPLKKLPGDFQRGLGEFPGAFGKGLEVVGDVAQGAAGAFGEAAANSNASDIINRPVGESLASLFKVLANSPLVAPTQLLPEDLFDPSGGVASTARSISESSPRELLRGVVTGGGEEQASAKPPGEPEFVENILSNILGPEPVDDRVNKSVTEAISGRSASGLSDIFTVGTRDVLSNRPGRPGFSKSAPSIGERVAEEDRRERLLEQLTLLSAKGSGRGDSRIEEALIKAKGGVLGDFVADDGLSRLRDKDPEARKVDLDLLLETMQLLQSPR